MTPTDLLNAFLAIYPSFGDDRAAETAVSHGYWDDEPDFQRIVMTFCQFFGVAAPTATPQQLMETAKLVNDAMDTGGDLEIAVSTGLLEHLHQINGTKFLLPHLSERAKHELREQGRLKDVLDDR